MILHVLVTEHLVSPINMLTFSHGGIKYHISFVRNLVGIKEFHFVLVKIDCRPNVLV